MKGKILLLVLGVTLAFTTACGRYIASPLSNEVLKGETDLNATPEFQKINAQVEAIEIESQKIEVEVARLSNLSPQKIKLGQLKDLVKNFKSYIETAQKMIADLRLQIQNQLSQLDPNNPAHQALIEQLEKALELLDKVDQQLASIANIVKDVVDQLFLKIEDAINNQVTSAPLKIVLKLLLEVLKAEVIKKLPVI